jgi:type IV pilus assembly protein PilB
MRLGEFLVSKGYLTEDQLRQALEARARGNKFLGQVLVDLGFVDADVVGSLLALQAGVPYVDLLTTRPEPAAVGMVPEAVIRKLNVLPVRLNGESLEVAMVDPLDTGTVDQLHLLTGRRITPLLTMGVELHRAVSDAFDMRSAPGMAPTVLPGEPRLAAQEPLPEASVVQLVDGIIEKALSLRASDLHFDPQERGLMIRYRIDGRMVDQGQVPSAQQAAIRARIKVLCMLDITENRRPQDGHMRFDYHGRAFDLRVSALPTVFGEKIVIRVLDKAAISVPLASLGLLPDQQQRLEMMLNEPHGMVLVVGPTGSGKTTTLYSSLNMLNDGTRNILTLEDPVEYNVAGLNQVQVNAQVGLTFAAGLRALMRQDPDIILVGEIRDPETAEMAVQASLTGHLLLSTLHTNSAVGTVARLQNLEVDRFLIAQALTGVISQRLVGRICEHCSASYRPHPDLLAAVGIGPGVADQMRFRKGLGCHACYGRGYRGRIGVFEVMTLDEDLRRLIMRNSPEAEIEAAAIRAGMRPFRESVLAAVQDGITTPEEMGRIVLASRS